MGMCGVVVSVGGSGTERCRRVVWKPAAAKRGARVLRMQAFIASRWTSRTRSFLEMKWWNSWVGFLMERIWSAALMK